MLVITDLNWTYKYKCSSIKRKKEKKYGNWVLGTIFQFWVWLIWKINEIAKYYGFLSMKYQSYLCPPGLNPQLLVAWITLYSGRQAFEFILGLTLLIWKSMKLKNIVDFSSIKYPSNLSPAWFKPTTPVVKDFHLFRNQSYKLEIIIFKKFAWVRFLEYPVIIHEKKWMKSFFEIQPHGFLPKSVNEDMLALQFLCQQRSKYHRLKLCDPRVSAGR